MNKLVGIGSSDLTKHRAGERLSAARAVRAKCADCQDNYVNGKNDCNQPKCPLYSWMPYGSEPREKSEAKVIAAKERMAEKKKNIKKQKRRQRNENKRI